MSLIVLTDLRKGNWAFGNKSDQWSLRPWLELLAAEALHHHSSPGCRMHPDSLGTALISVLYGESLPSEAEELYINYSEYKGSAISSFLSYQLNLWLPLHMSVKQRPYLQIPILTPLGSVCSHVIILYYWTCNNYLHNFLQCFASYCKQCEFCNTFWPRTDYSYIYNFMQETQITVTYHIDHPVAL